MTRKTVTTATVPFFCTRQTMVGRPQAAILHPFSSPPPPTCPTLSLSPQTRRPPGYVLISRPVPPARACESGTEDAGVSIPLAPRRHHAASVPRSFTAATAPRSFAAASAPRSFTAATARATVNTKTTRGRCADLAFWRAHSHTGYFVFDFNMPWRGPPISTTAEGYCTDRTYYTVPTTPSVVSYN